MTPTKLRGPRHARLAPALPELLAREVATHVLGKKYAHLLKPFEACLQAAWRSTGAVLKEARTWVSPGESLATFKAIDEAFKSSDLARVRTILRQLNERTRVELETRLLQLCGVGLLDADAEHLVLSGHTSRSDVAKDGRGILRRTLRSASDAELLEVVRPTVRSLLHDPKPKRGRRRAHMNAKTNFALTGSFIRDFEQRLGSLGGMDPSKPRTWSRAAVRALRLYQHRKAAQEVPELFRLMDPLEHDRTARRSKNSTSATLARPRLADAPERDQETRPG